MPFAKNVDTSKVFWDKQDYDLIKNYSWCLTGKGYLGSQINRKMVKLHHLIIKRMNPNSTWDDKIVVHHKDSNKTNNKRDNLKLVPQSFNVFKAKLPWDNKAGYSGVIWRRKLKRWRAVIVFNNKQIYGGQYENVTDAIKKRREMELKYFGEYSNPNWKEVN